MADIRNQKPDDYVRQLVDEEFNRERKFVESAQDIKNEKRLNSWILEKE